MSDAQMEIGQQILLDALHIPDSELTEADRDARSICTIANMADVLAGKLRPLCKGDQAEWIGYAALDFEALGRKLRRIVENGWH